LAIGGHLGDVSGNERHLYNQVYLTGSLNRYGTISLSIFFSNAGLSERSVFKQNVDLTVNGAHGGEPVDLANQAWRICFSQGRKQLRNLNFLVSAKESTPADKQQSRDQSQRNGSRDRGRV